MKDFAAILLREITYMDSLFVLRSSQPSGVMSSAVSLPNHTLMARLSPLRG